VASGTATLEAAWFGLPYCLLYRVAWPTYVVGKAVVKVDYLGIVNILASREVVRELIQGAANPETLSSHLGHLLDHPDERAALQTALAEVVRQLGQAGTHDRAADAVMALLAETQEAS
jgi:lipid-A-disaccharide synthase